MVKKKPKPAGCGKYRVCPHCGGTGDRMHTRKYPKSPTGEAITFEACKFCKTKGWIEA